MIIVRYADDFIAGFEHEADARRFLDAMRKRLGEFALSLNDEKTRLIEFGRFAAQNRKRCGLGKPETFNFLGFTFICGKSRRGKFLIKRKSRRDRMRAKLQAIRTGTATATASADCHARQMADPGRYRILQLPAQCRPTNERLQRSGTNSPEAGSGYSADADQRGAINWERMRLLANTWLPRPRILHPWPNQRFAVTHPRWEPYAGKPHVRFCAGALSNGRPYRDP